MNILSITWQETIPLRQSVLWPDKSADYSQIEGDDNALHFGVFSHGEIVSVASVFLSSRSAQLRKFATDKRFQNQGIGTKMLQPIINELKCACIDEFWCDARESAIGFYARFGMCVASERFYKGSIAYFRMEVSL